jgi:TatD DNase family protein
VVALGECGLDYYYVETFFEKDKQEKGISWNKDAEVDRQKRIFEEHINLASELRKPLMLHIRDVKGSYDAYEDALHMLENAQVSGKNVRGNVHFFAGNIDIAQKFLDIGFTISFPGTITFTKEYDDVVRFVPLDMLHAETDSPYAAPVPYRGKRNEPVYVQEVVAKIAVLKEISIEEVRVQLLENAKRVFGLTF